MKYLFAAIVLCLSFLVVSTSVEAKELLTKEELGSIAVARKFPAKYSKSQVDQLKPIAVVVRSGNKANISRQWKAFVQKKQR